MPCALAAALVPSLAQAQSFEGIGLLPGGTQSLALGVSADGSTVVGRGGLAVGFEAVRWRAGTLVGLGDVAGGPHESSANGVSADGSVIVGTGRDASVHRGVRWDDTTMTQLPQFAGHSGYSECMGVSSDGQTLCGYNSNGTITGYGSITGVRIDAGVLTALPYTPAGTSGFDSGCYQQPSEDGRVLSGRVRVSGAQYQACCWVDTTLTLLPQLPGGPIYSQCFGISGDGSVQVGVSCSSASPATLQGEACRWENGAALSLGALPGAAHVSMALSANRDGSTVVGLANDSTGASRAFIWDAQNGMRDLKTVLLSDYGIASSGWTLTAARAITPEGDVIVGYGTNPSGLTEGWIARLGGAASYCTAGTSASGCQALLSASGVASPTAGAGFTVSALGVEGSKDGLLFFGQNGRQANSWGNGTSYQCVVPPVKRAGVLAGVGTSGSCNGSFAQDLNAHWCTLCPKSNHAPTAGSKLQLQLWYRDPANTSNQTTSLSDALEVDVKP